MSSNIYSYQPHDFILNYMIRHPEVILAEDKYSNKKRAKNPVRLRIEDKSEPNYFVDHLTYIIGTSNNELIRVSVNENTSSIIEKEGITNRHSYKWTTQPGDDQVIKDMVSVYESSPEYVLDRIMYFLKSSGLHRSLLPVIGAKVEINDKETIFTALNAHVYSSEDCIVDYKIVINDNSILVTLQPHVSDKDSQRVLEYDRDNDVDQNFQDIVKWIVTNMNELEQESVEYRYEQ